MHVDFRVESVSEFADRMAGAVDVLLVDPPWGQRHSNFSKVMKNINAWAKDWVRDRPLITTYYHGDAIG